MFHLQRSEDGDREEETDDDEDDGDISKIPEVDSDEEECIIDPEEE